MPFNHRADVGRRNIPCAPQYLLWHLRTRRVSPAPAQSSDVRKAVSSIEGRMLGSGIQTGLGGPLPRLTVGPMAHFGPPKRHNGAERIPETDLLVSG
jgi:hypothetical protein